jgi:RNA polymerase sigma factor (sigma-70 family)
MAVELRAELTDKGIDKFVRRGADRYAPLSHEKLLKAFKRMQRYPLDHHKHIAARTKIVHHNQRYVVRTAVKYLNKGLPLEDLIQEGNCGLMTAIRKFDPARGFRFSTYADFWIKEAIRSAIKTKARLIRIPNQKHQLKVQVQREYAYAHTILHTTMTSAELAKATGLTIAQVEEMKTYDYDFESLDAPVSYQRDTKLSETLTDADSLTPEEQLIAREQYSELYEAIGELPAEDAKFIRRLFGLGGLAKRTEVQMSELYMQPASVVRQRTKIILEKLHGIMRSQLLAESA